MPTHHKVDTSVRFVAHADLPEQRHVEKVDVEPVPDAVGETVAVGQEPYICPAELEDAVNVAIALGRPLLLQGDSGAGKTRLAHAVAYNLGLPLEQVHVKSTTRASDLLYGYDAVRRLYDAQLPGGLGGADDVARYIRLGPLGRAIVRASLPVGRRSVVLIDEIDKADIDFPNDLLQVIEELTFDIPEQPGRRHAVPTDRTELRPIIFVTNNEEKVLPDAFLRRCVFHYVRFPSGASELNRILDAHDIDDPVLRAGAIDVLLRLRTLDLVKKPGVSELLDWVGYLQAVKAKPEQLEETPYLGTLLKTRTDLDAGVVLPPAPQKIRVRRVSPPDADAAASG